MAEESPIDNNDRDRVTNQFAHYLLTAAIFIEGNAFAQEFISHNQSAAEGYAIGGGIFVLGSIAAGLSNERNRRQLGGWLRQHLPGFRRNTQIPEENREGMDNTELDEFGNYLSGPDH